MPFANPFRVLTPAEMLTKQLADAERLRVQYQANEEEARFSVSMLNERITRIRAELHEINSPVAETTNTPEGVQK
jgi:hypothetical protein